jgi:hypothetical protein
MREVIQQLLQEGLTSVHLLRTFFSPRIQPLQQRVIKMCLYPRPCCPDRSFSEELSNVEINTQIHKVLDNRAELNPWAGLTPLREGVASTRVSLFRSIFSSLHDFILSTRSWPYVVSWVCSHCTVGHQLARGCGKVGGESCSQREDVGVETKKADVQCRSLGGEGVGA